MCISTQLNVTVSRFGLSRSLQMSLTLISCSTQGPLSHMALMHDHDPLSFFCSATVKRNNISIHYWVMLTFDYQTLIQQSIPAEPSHPLPSQDTAGHLSAFSVPGVVHLQIFHCLGAEHLPTRGLFPSLWHARSFLSEYNYTEDITEKKQISSCQGQVVVKACSRFYACISSLLIKPELPTETRELSMWINTFWLVNQISVDILSYL